MQLVLNQKRKLTKMATLGRLAIPAITDEQHLKIQEVLEQIAKVKRNKRAFTI